ncbi:hypothetical protein IV203_022362 [Nitzschia inconspicua]|uniref:Uncharacterized protein n=1 Tax=Nitzschia inconspicua TaxID=303405 RepID=A0A9K3PGR6_9STRA|nr:hypothetical protein IV203_022362 [Nitzschia inconspicua]
MFALHQTSSSSSGNQNSENTSFGNPNGGTPSFRNKEGPNGSSSPSFGAPNGGNGGSAKTGTSPFGSSSTNGSTSFGSPQNGSVPSNLENTQQLLHHQSTLPITVSFFCNYGIDDQLLCTAYVNISSSAPIVPKELTKPQKSSGMMLIRSSFPFILHPPENVAALAQEWDAASLMNPFQRQIQKSVNICNQYECNGKDQADPPEWITLSW